MQIPLVLDILWKMHCLEIFNIYCISLFEKKQSKTNHQFRARESNEDWKTDGEEKCRPQVFG